MKKLKKKTKISYVILIKTDSIFISYHFFPLKENRYIIH